MVSLSGEELVATHYGFYSTIVGVGTLVGNLAIGALMSTAHRLNVDESSGVDVFSWASPRCSG